MDQFIPEPELSKLDTPQPCSFRVFSNQTCPDLAIWAISNQPICKAHMESMAAMNSDNEEFLAPALTNSEKGANS